MLKNNENIVFGKMDGTANDIPYMFPPIKVSKTEKLRKHQTINKSFQGFPAVFFISAYEKYDPILYQGDRSYKSVKDWINRYFCCILCILSIMNFI